MPNSKLSISLEREKKKFAKKSLPVAKKICQKKIGGDAGN